MLLVEWLVASVRESEELVLAFGLPVEGERERERVLVNRGTKGGREAGLRLLSFPIPYPPAAMERRERTALRGQARRTGQRVRRGSRRIRVPRRGRT